MTDDINATIHWLLHELKKDFLREEYKQQIKAQLLALTDAIIAANNK